MPDKITSDPKVKSVTKQSYSAIENALIPLDIPEKIAAALRLTVAETEEMVRGGQIFITMFAFPDDAVLGQRLDIASGYRVYLDLDPHKDRAWIKRLGLNRIQ